MTTLKEESYMTTLAEKPTNDQDIDENPSQAAFSCVSAVDSLNFPFAEETRLYLQRCQEIWDRCEGLKRKAKLAIAEGYGYSVATLNKLIKVWTAFGSLPIENLLMLDSETLRKIASDKYARIHETLWEQPLTVKEAGELAQLINAENKKPKEQRSSISLLFKKVGSPAVSAFEERYEETLVKFASQNEEVGPFPPNLYLQRVNELLEDQLDTFYGKLGISTNDSNVSVEDTYTDIASYDDIETKFQLRLKADRERYHADSHEEYIEEVEVVEYLEEIEEPEESEELNVTPALNHDKIGLAPTPCIKDPQYPTIPSEEGASYLSNFGDSNTFSHQETTNKPMVFLPASDRFQKGWHVGQAVRLNTTAQKVMGLVEFCRGTDYLIVSNVFGKFKPGEIQRMELVSADGEICPTYCFGNWVEDDDQICLRVAAALNSTDSNPYKKLVEEAKEVISNGKKRRAETKISKMKQDAESAMIWFDELKMSLGVLIFRPDGIDFLAGTESVIEQTLF